MIPFSPIKNDREEPCLKAQVDLLLLGGSNLSRMMNISGRPLATFWLQRAQDGGQVHHVISPLAVVAQS